MATHEAAHGTECEFPGCETGKPAVHHVLVAQYGHQGDRCAFHSPYEGLPETNEDTLTDEEMDPDYPEYIETPELVSYAPGFKFVNVYELDLAFGGPEEGGWWVDCGTLITSRQVHTESAEDMKISLEIKYPTANQSKERGERQSRYTDVNYHGGDYRVYIEDKPGEDFPKVFPHYE